jgi:hypothetical protein
VTKRNIAILTNTTVHTYYAYEQEKMDIPREISIMISKIYNIEEREIFCHESEISDNTIYKLKQLSSLSENNRNVQLIYNLTGLRKDRVSFNQIHDIVDSIRKSL